MWPMLLKVEARFRFLKAVVRHTTVVLTNNRQEVAEVLAGPGRLSFCEANGSGIGR
jgi:hypothetical protein